MPAASIAPIVSGRARAPAYRRICDELRAQIRSGALRPHDRLPSESALMQRFNVSRVTIRQALDALREDGLVHSMQGKGSFVSMPKVIQDPGTLLGFHEVLEGRGYAGLSRVLSMRSRKACHEVAQALHVRRKTPVLELRRLRCLGEMPVSYDVSHFPIDIGAKLVEEDLARDIFPLLESRCKVALGRAEVRVEALACDADTAAILDLDVGAPVLYLRRVTATSQGRPIDYEHLYCRGDAWQYRLELTRRSRR